MTFSFDIPIELHFFLLFILGCLFLIWLLTPRQKPRSSGRSTAYSGSGSSIYSTSGRNNNSDSSDGGSADGGCGGSGGCGGG